MRNEPDEQAFEGWGYLQGPDPARAPGCFLRWLRTCSVQRTSEDKRYKKIVKSLARALRIPLRHTRFLKYVYGNPYMCAYQERDPRILERHLHRYINQHWKPASRLHCISQHYQFALNQLPQVLFRAIYLVGDAILGTLVLKDGGRLKLSLKPPIPMGCEGELTIQLSDMDDHPLYRIILTVMDDASTLVIGCLQGPGGPHAKEVVRKLTRNMHGMRPKQLMLSLTYAFAQHYGMTRIWAVSNEGHPLRSSRRAFYADYDVFWKEQNARMADGGWFVLPEQLVRKSELEVPSHRRAEFRRRETLRIEAETLLVNALGPKRSETRHHSAGVAFTSVPSARQEVSWAS